MRGEFVLRRSSHGTHVHPACTCIVVVVEWSSANLSLISLWEQFLSHTPAHMAHGSRLLVAPPKRRDP